MSMTLTPIRFPLLALLAGALAAALFLPGLGGGFLLDDVQTIVQNWLIRVDRLDGNALLDAASSFHAGGGSRPLAMLSFALDYWRGGGVDAATFKATNLVIHGLTTVALALLLRRVLALAGWSAQRAAVGALLMALAWAVHPLQVSSVLYVVQRMQTLSTLFLVLALWAYLGLRQAQMAGQRAWLQGLLALAFWVLALASKEDAAMLPAYCLLLEVTVLQFRAAQPWRERSLRRTWLLAVLAGVALYLLWAVPHYWRWQAYAGRDFSSLERLLTQGRVLAMYLGQIVLPLPDRMPFHYDTLVISRGLMRPATTLPALLLVVALVGWAWAWRRRRPVFAFGVLLFFAGHFITSNVIGLELAFEHRNHFALIGAIVALGDLLAAAAQHWRVPPRWCAVIAGILLAGLCVSGAMRAYAWGDPIRLAHYHARIAPDSSRAWLELGGAYFDLAGKRAGKDSPYLALAIEAVEDGAAQTDSTSAFSNIVTYKSIQGTVTRGDWDRLAQRLETARMTPPTRNILWTTLKNLRAGVGLDETQAMRVIEIIGRRAAFSPAESLHIGHFILSSVPAQRQHALPWFVRAAGDLPVGDSRIIALASKWEREGQTDWAAAVRQANAAGRHTMEE
jgi:hypothetical protein